MWILFKNLIYIGLTQLNKKPAAWNPKLSKVWSSW